MTVTESGTYAIAADELESAATHQLRILRTGSALFIDVRQPYGTYFDNFLPGSGPVNGVLLRRGLQDYVQQQPSLLDATPNTAVVRTTRPSRLGQSITDPDSGVTSPPTRSRPAARSSRSRSRAARTTRPSVPGNVTATPTGGGTTDVDLTWTAATDDGSVDRLPRVPRRRPDRRAGRAQLPRRRRPTAGSATASPRSTTRTWTSAVAGAAPVSVGDTVPPTVPTACRPRSSRGQVTLTWEASTDDLGVTCYRVYRGASVIKSVTTTQTIDSTGHPGVTYSYSVAAVDGAGERVRAARRWCR